MNQKHIVVIGVLVAFVFACSRELPADKARTDPGVFAGFKQPGNFPASAYHFETNPVTREGFELGRKLFYEPRLSRNNTISCGSCHIQSSAFTQHGHDVSHGIDDRLGSRNAPAIMNLAWSPLLMWDGGIFDLDLQPIAPITNHEEMDETVANVVSKLQALPQYRALFKKAFGTEQISTGNLMKALSQFMVMCISSRSKYDSVMRREGRVAFTPEEAAGQTLVVQKCGGCHKEPLFTDGTFRNNGIGVGANNDQGRYAVTLQPADQYRFKVPSLRNLAYTAPYMHDGRFYTLDAVLDHYAAGVKPTPNLDPLLTANGQRGIALTDEERGQILAFLHTLNDRAFVTDKLLAEQ
ncbi:cytochrome-c peroxidase [Niabella sp. CC-SYL272]|uniref:cytochrome-c peroxidase n=1 Tax=Niabella agricola TaxID=2891571 RepID=UPI001F16AA6F|nr:cytochrome c peroxidase [Niabella agricola]MCF3107988.1 cytochrome-c peroxidase [Niabella agricola]